MNFEQRGPGPLNRALAWVRRHYHLPGRFANPRGVTRYTIGDTTVGEFRHFPRGRWRRLLYRL